MCVEVNSKVDVMCCCGPDGDVGEAPHQQLRPWGPFERLPNPLACLHKFRRYGKHTWFMENIMSHMNKTNRKGEVVRCLHIQFWLPNRFLKASGGLKVPPWTNATALDQQDWIQVLSKPLGSPVKTSFRGRRAQQTLPLQASARRMRVRRGQSLYVVLEVKAATTV